MPHIIIDESFQSQRHEKRGYLDRKHHDKGEIARVRIAENKECRGAELRKRVETVNV